MDRNARELELTSWLAFPFEGCRENFRAYLQALNETQTWRKLPQLADTHATAKPFDLKSELEFKSCLSRLFRPNMWGTKLKTHAIKSCTFQIQDCQRKDENHNKTLIFYLGIRQIAPPRKVCCRITPVILHNKTFSANEGFFRPYQFDICLPLCIWTQNNVALNRMDWIVLGAWKFPWKFQSALTITQQRMTKKEKHPAFPGARHQRQMHTTSPAELQKRKDSVAIGNRNVTLILMHPYGNAR